MKILLFLSIIAINLSAQSPHPMHERIVLHTNVTQEVVLETEPCVTYHYYGILHSGGIREMGASADHDPLTQQWENGDFGPDYKLVLRSETPAAKLVIIQQHLEPNPVARFPPGFEPFNPPNPPMPNPFIQQTNNITKN